MLPQDHDRWVAESHEQQVENQSPGPAVAVDEGMDAQQLRALTDQSFKGWLRRAFKASYPWMNTSFEGWLLVCNIAYLFDRTPLYRPWLSWIGVDLRRLGLDDFVRSCTILVCAN